MIRAIKVDVNEKESSAPGTIWLCWNYNHRVPTYLSREIITSFPRKSEQLVICRASLNFFSGYINITSAEPSTLHDTVVIMLEQSNVPGCGY